MAEGHHKCHVKESKNPGIEQPNCSNHHCSTIFVVQTLMQGHMRCDLFALSGKDISVFDMAQLDTGRDKT